MSRIEEKVICLYLNKNWQVIGQKNVKDAMTDFVGGSESDSVLALDIEYDFKEDGSADFSKPTSATPTPWRKWVSLPVREWDFSIHSPKLEIRVPTVLIASSYSGMPVKKLNLTKDNVWSRDKGVCQYTGKRLSKEEGDIDHIIPKARGGKDSWDNMVVCEKKINQKKGGRLNSEMGLKLIKPAKEPVGVPMFSIIRDLKHEDWSHFVFSEK